jgi:di/tricarboxylate transporter
MAEIWTVFAIIAAVVGLFMWDRLPVVVVCLGCALALWATGILTLNQSLAGFGDPATIFIASLFVIGGGLEAAGVTAWAGQALSQQAGDSRARLLVLMMALVGALSALISVNGAVAALLPVVIVLAVRLGRSPAQLLMPLVFAGHAGSMLLLTGSPVNVLVSDTLLESTGRSFGYVEFVLVGAPLLAGVVAVAVLFGARLLPVRDSANLPPDLSRHARTLVEQYRLTSDVYALRVHPASPLVGAPRAELDLSDRAGVQLVTIKAADAATPVHGGGIEAGDVIVVRGAAEAVGLLAGELDLGIAEDAVSADRMERTLFNRSSGLAEVLVPPRSPLIGRRFFPGMVTDSGDMIVLAIQRQGEDLPRDATLAAGDTLLLQGTWDALDRRLNPARVIVVNAPDLVRRQAVPLGLGARKMIGVLAALVVALALGLAPPAAAGLLAACAILVLGVLSVEATYRAINWTTVILIGAMMPLSTAISETGAAQLLAEGLVALLGEAGPRALLAGLFLLTAVLGQVISNTATAFIIIPIAVVAAAEMGVSPAPFLMGVCIAAAGAFLTPVATPTNLMVQEPAAYRFGDYWRFGLPMLAWFFVVAVFLVPTIWPF